jgi:hypothetical protein
MTAQSNGAPATPPAGWYPDGSGSMRWWDGAAWTEHFQPPVTAAQTPAAVTGEYVGRGVKNPAQLYEVLQRHLVDGEHVEGVFAVARVNPTADLLIITNIRVISAWRNKLDTDLTPFTFGSKLEDFTIDKSMGGLNGIRVGITQAGIGESKVGTLRHKEDIPALRDRLQAFLDRAPDETSLALEETVVDHLIGRSHDTLRSAGMREDSTEQELAIVQSGEVPVKASHLLRPMLGHLELAEEAAEKGDIATEEDHLGQALALAQTAGLGQVRKVRAWLLREIDEAIADETLRIGMTTVGTVNDESWTKKNSVIIGSDRILYGGKGYPLDHHVAAAVELDGQLLESSRPTMTRMAIGSVLPGSALLVGLAMPKKTTTDTRTAHLVMVHPTWRIVVPIARESVPKVRPLTSQRNAISKAMEGAGGAQPALGALAVPELEIPQVVEETESEASSTSGVDNRMDRLERIAELKDRGVIDEEEAKRLRAEVLDA